MHIYSIGNFSLEGWEPTPVEQALMNGTFKPTLKESRGAIRKK